MIFLMLNVKRFYNTIVSVLAVSFFGALSYFLSYFSSVGDSSVLRSPIPPFNPYVFLGFALVFFLFVLIGWSYTFYKLSNI